jgi:hypothetical protein
VLPPLGAALTLGPAYGRATPALRPAPASSIQIVARRHPDCRRAGTHDVGLSVNPTITNAPLAVTGGTNVGFCIGVHGGTVAQNATLDLQTCSASSPAQRFAIDGDAIMMGSQASGKVTRDFVIQRENGSTSGVCGTVVATRDLWEE